MKYFFKFLWINALIMLFSISLIQAQNTIVNGGFEDGIGNWVFTSANGSIATSEIVQNEIHSGSNSLKIIVTKLGLNPADIQLVNTGISVQKDLVYVLTLWAKSDSNGFKSRVIFSNTPASSLNFNDETELTFSSEWKQYEVIFPSPVTSTDEVQFSVQFGKNTGTVYLDDISFEKKGNSWYDGSEYRIDKYRKGNFTIKVQDASGHPVSDSIIIKQKKHDFPWGIAVDLTDKSSGNTYTAAKAITAPGDSEIYRTERYAPYLCYLLPSESGIEYKLTIMLSENYVTAVNTRLFDAYIYGEKVIQNIDKYDWANGEFIAFDTTITVIATDTIIKLEFYSTKDNAAIMGLVLSDNNGTPILRLNCGGPAMTTKSGNTYKSDISYIDKNSVMPTTSNDDWLKANMLKYCNFGVCGNSFKWSGIEANQGILTYENFDNTLNWFHKVGWDMRAHCLLWGGTSSTDYHELPQWVGKLAPAVMYDTCKMRVFREMTRYKGIVKDYDVINEPIHATYLQSKVGDSIDWNCFKWAHEADPDARLFVNEYNIVEWQGETDQFISLLNTMLQHGAPVSGIGSQCHMGTSIDIPNVKARFDQLAQFGIPIKITEFDMAANNMTQQDQAIETAKMMRLIFSHPAIEGFIFWGLADPGWRPEIGNLINVDKTPKIAADTVYHLIHEAWSTSLKDTTDTSGMYSFRGFYGDYDVSVKIGNDWKKYSIPFIKNNEENEVLLKEEDGMVMSPVLKKVQLNAPAGLELTFDKPMADPTMEFKNFKVFDTLSNTVKSAMLKDGDPTTIVLTMKTSIKAGKYITVSYYPGNQKSSDGGILELFGPVLDETLTPAYLSASTTTDGKKIAIAFNKFIADTSVHQSDFIVLVNKKTRAITSASLNATLDTMVLVLSSQILSDKDVITVSYIPGSLITTDLLAVTSFTSKSVLNNVLVPEMRTATSSEDGATIQLRFSVSMADPSAEDVNFTVTINSEDVSVTNVELSATNDHYIILTLSSPMLTEDKAVVKYKPGDLKSTDGIPVTAFTANVVNKTITGIDEISRTDQIQLYPNPVTDKLFISNITGYNTVSISNMLGQEMIRLNIPESGRLTINTSNLKGGFYLLSIYNKESKKVFKLLKR